MKKVILSIIAVVLLSGCAKQTTVEKKAEVNGLWKKCPEFLAMEDRRCIITDLNGDGKTDIGIYDPSTAEFRVILLK